MKAILEFNLPDDVDAFTLATNAGSLYHVLWQFDQYLRNTIKHGVNGEIINIDTTEHLRRVLSNIMESNNLSFDMVS